jgi:hypothetical protein
VLVGKNEPRKRKKSRAQFELDRPLLTLQQRLRGRKLTDEMSEEIYSTTRLKMFLLAKDYEAVHCGQDTENMN